MPNESLEYKKVKEALTNLTRAEKEYEKIVLQYVSITNVVIGKQIPSPKPINLKALSEMDLAEKKKQAAQEALRKALANYRSPH